VRAVAATPRYARRREEILDAAAAVFNAQGVSGASIADVAAAVGVTPTSITYYFRRREELAAACVHRALEALDQLLARAEGAGGPAAQLRTFVDLYFAQLQAMAEGRSPPLINFWDLRARPARPGKAPSRASSPCSAGSVCCSPIRPPAPSRGRRETRGRTCCSPPSSTPRSGRAGTRPPTIRVRRSGSTTS
jgi:AcrR family transcriptional regulator